MDVEQLVVDVQEACSSETVSKDKVRDILERAGQGKIENVSVEDGECDYETIVSRLGVVVDMELGVLQKEWEDHVVENDGVIVEEDGVVYGFDESGVEL